ncbi:MAG TPA: hypothetical protein VKS01_06570 [Bryobacteraceae bacterium]|nr:hypothetical protein [Bryobacteraceae bacterium]
MRFRIFGLVIAMAGAMLPVNAQWLNYPERGTPKTRDGKPNLPAKAPRVHGGKPDLSGVWRIEPPPPGENERLFGGAFMKQAEGDDPREFSKYFLDLFIDFKNEESPVRPEAAALAATRRQTMDTPTSHCLPLGIPAIELIAFPFKIFQTPDAIAIFYETNGVFRQIHIDGRKLPEDPVPAWMGYSTGRWEGDTLVVETAGFNDKSWMDSAGHARSEALHVEERFHRRDFGHLDVQATVDDPKILTRPVTIKFTELLIPDSDVLEFFCAEGERDRAHMPTSIP